MGNKEEQIKKKKKKAKGKRNSRSEKHEKTPSILWKDVKSKSKSKKSKSMKSSSKNETASSQTNKYNVGDRVRLTKGRVGTIRYVGKPHFAKDERIGIECDKWSAKGHDGRVGKFRYFSTKYGHGTFVTPTAIIEIMENAKNDKTGKNAQFGVGDYVLVKDNRKGIIRYIGATGIVKGCLVGIELDEQSPGGHDGRFGGKSYFECPDGHGMFVRLLDIIKIIKTKQRIERESNPNIDTIPDDLKMDENEVTISDKVKVGDRVTLSNNKQGIIKFIGNTEFSENKPMLGIELDSEDPKATDGSVGNKSYFKTQMGRGIFVRRASVISFNSFESVPDNEEEESEDDDDDMDFDDYVELENGSKGIIKFIGKTDFAKGELIGVEMETWDPDGHDGSKHNKRYFSCKQGHGLWTRREKIKKYLKIPPHLKGKVNIKQLLQPTYVDGKKKDFTAKLAEIEDEQKEEEK